MGRTLAALTMACGLAVGLRGQALIQSARDVLSAPRPLTTAEISQVLAASRQAIADKTFHLSLVPRGQGLAVLMGASGRPKTTRMTYGLQGGFVSGTRAGGTATETRWHENFITIVDYTGQPARRCDGEIEPGHMAIEYVHRSSTEAWTATARREGTPEPGAYARALGVLTEPTVFTTGDQNRIGERSGRALVAPWTRPPGTARNGFGIREDNPVGATERLWIDTESLLPLRWEVVFEGVSTYALTFTYEPLDLRPPADVDAPDCIR